MNSQYDSQIRSSGTYNQHPPSNTYGSYENQGVNKGGFNPVQFGPAGIQNNGITGQMPYHNPQVQSSSAPPPNQSLNQMSHDLNSMHISQAQYSSNSPQPNIGQASHNQTLWHQSGPPDPPPAFATCPPPLKNTPHPGFPPPQNHSYTPPNGMSPPPSSQSQVMQKQPSPMSSQRHGMPQSHNLATPSNQSLGMPPLSSQHTLSNQNYGIQGNPQPQPRSMPPPQSSQPPVGPPPSHNQQFGSSLPPQTNSFPPPQQNTYPPPPQSRTYPPPPTHHGDRSVPPMQDPARMASSDINDRQRQLSGNSSVYNGNLYGSSNSNMHARYPPPTLSPNSASNQAPAYGQYGNSYNQTGHVQQPQVNKRVLDPDNMPSPIQVIEEDRKLKGSTFSTAQRGLVPPLVTTNFTVVDEGLCSPRFIRSTIYAVPTTADLLKQTHVPFALAISPFAQVHEDEYPPPIVDPGEEGPVRCHRCRAYMSPFMQFVDAGRRFQCMLCKTTSEVPVHYFSHLDHMGERVDKMERAELCLGSYEFIVNKDYCKEGKFPNCPAFIFLIDVSYNSIRSGMVQTLCNNMRSVLDTLPREDNVDESKLRVGFITYSTVVHFYNISKNLAQPQMLVVSDINDMFMPLLDGFLVHPSESSAVIDSLMEQIPAMFSDTRETETVLGPAIQAGLEALKAAECVGKLFLFHSTLPIAEAPGKLKNRDDRKLLATEKEKTILAPQTPFYNNLGQECVKAGCSVDLFLFNNAYIDVATLGQICRLTGGSLFKYTYFQSDLDGERFLEDLRREVEKPISFDAVIRVRTSTGIRPVDFNGGFFMSNTTDVELAAVTSDFSLTTEIRYDDKLPDEDGILIQVAALFTSCGGQRRLRVHNLALQPCQHMADLFRSCELDTLLNVMVKDGVRRVTEEIPRTIRERVTATSAQILACYRRHCAQASSAGQLILPECLKLLPLYICCLNKCDALAGGQEMTTDDRSFIMLAVLNMDVDSTAAYLYPRMLPMHDTNPPAPPIENITLPTAIRCSLERMKDNGVYLVENGLSMFLWVGPNVDPEWIQDVFGVPSVVKIDVEKPLLLPLNTALSHWVRTVIEVVQCERERHMKLHIVRAGDPGEMLLRQLLVEDRTTEGSASYVDFLCHLHKEIRTLLS